MATPILDLVEISTGQARKEVTHNEALRQLEARIIRVLSRSNGGPPASPTDGDAYIVDAQTGDWAYANVNEIAHYSGGEWHYFAPKIGHRIWVVNEGILVVYKGSTNGWVPYTKDIKSALYVTGTFDIAAGDYDWNSLGVHYSASLEVYRSLNNAKILVYTEGTGKTATLHLRSGTKDFYVSTDSSGASFTIETHEALRVSNTASGAQISFYGATPVGKQTRAVVADNTTAPNTSDAPTNALINNLRDRINELESFLVNLGLIA